MAEYLGAIILIITGVALALCSVIIGAWIMFKAKAEPGVGFLREPKGDVFTIAEEGLEEASGEPSKEEKSILERTEKFMNILGGR